MPYVRFASKLMVLGLSASLMLTACQAPNTDQQVQTSQTQLQTIDGITINNDKEKLQERVQKKNENVPIDSSGFSTQQLNPLNLQLVAEVAPPNIKGTTVQATNVHIEGNLAYVSYDIAGDGFSGGAYIIDISDPRNPKLLSEITSDDTDFYSLTKDGDALYLSGASPHRRLKSPALLQVMQLNNQGSAFVDVKGHVDLPSFAATDVSVYQNNAYVTTGDKGGGVAKIDKEKLTQTKYYPLEDARSVSVDYEPNGQTKVTAFKGSGGSVHILDTDLNLTKKIDLPGTATIPVSKSTVEIQNNLAIIGAGDGGTLAVNLDSAQTLATFKTDGEGITNGASIDGNFVFMAEGFDGVGVAERTPSGAINRLGKIKFKNDASANMVMLKNNVLFVANGKGGLRILTVNDDTPAALPGYHSVMFRSHDGSNKNDLVKTRTTVKLSAGAKLIGIITDKNNKKIPNLLASDKLFSGSITPNMPELLNKATDRHFETNGTGASGDWYKFVDDKTVEIQFNVTSGADDMRLLIDYGDTPAPDQFMTVTLHPEITTEAGIIVGDDDEEVMERNVPLTDGSGNIIVDGNYTLQTEIEDMDLIIMREGTAERGKVPSEIIDKPNLPPTPGKADIVFILDGGNSPSQRMNAIKSEVYAFIDGLKAANADVTFAVATSATKFKKHPHNDDVDATKLVLDATDETAPVKSAIENHPNIAGTSMDTYSSLVETIANPTQGTLEEDQVTRRLGADGKPVPLIQIVLTDHQPEQLRGKFVNYPKSDDPQREQDVATFLKDNNACVHVVLQKGFFDRYDAITEATGGSLINIDDVENLKTHLDQIAKKVQGLKPSPLPSEPSPEPSPEATPEPTPVPAPEDPCKGSSENWVVDGGFETPVIGQNWTFVNELGCWKIGAPGKAELDGVNTWTPAEGKQSLDLNPDQPGEIYQELYTQPGQDYELSFAMAGNVTSQKGIKTLEVFWGEHSIGEFAFDTTGKTKTNMGWETKSVSIPGKLTTNKRTRLTFKSTTEKSSVGPVIDNVVVK